MCDNSFEKFKLYIRRRSFNSFDGCSKIQKYLRNISHQVIRAANTDSVTLFLHLKSEVSGGKGIICVGAVVFNLAGMVRCNKYLLGEDLNCIT